MPALRGTTVKGIDVGGNDFCRLIWFVRLAGGENSGLGRSPKGLRYGREDSLLRGLQASSADRPGGGVPAGGDPGQIVSGRQRLADRRKLPNGLGGGRRLELRLGQEPAALALLALDPIGAVEGDLGRH